MRDTAAEESGMTFGAVADRRAESLPCRKCHDERFEVVKVSGT